MAAKGLIVGRAVGGSVGVEVDGRYVCLVVGTRVGRAVGPWVGFAVGPLDGLKVVGAREGLDVGIVVGLQLGPGYFEGAVVGKVEGLFEGMGVGPFTMMPHGQRRLYAF